MCAAPASAQDKPVRIRGTVEAVDGPMLSIKTRDGADLKVKMSDNVNVVALVKSSLADIKPGMNLAVTALKFLLVVAVVLLIVAVVRAVMTRGTSSRI